MGFAGGALSKSLVVIESLAVQLLPSFDVLILRLWLCQRGDVNGSSRVKGLTMAVGDWGSCILNHHFERCGESGEVRSKSWHLLVGLVGLMALQLIRIFRVFRFFDFTIIDIYNKCS